MSIIITIIKHMIAMVFCQWSYWHLLLSTTSYIYPSIHLNMSVFLFYWFTIFPVIPIDLWSSRNFHGVHVQFLRAARVSQLHAVHQRVLLPVGVEFHHRTQPGHLSRCLRHIFLDCRQKRSPKVPAVEVSHLDYYVS